MRKRQTTRRTHWTGWYEGGSSSTANQWFIVTAVNVGGCGWGMNVLKAIHINILYGRLLYWGEERELSWPRETYYYYYWRLLNCISGNGGGAYVGEIELILQHATYPDELMYRFHSRLGDLQKTGNEKKMNKKVIVRKQTHGLVLRFALKPTGEQHCNYVVHAVLFLYSTLEGL